jgi:phenylalanyl-tRNA synthetase beta chain
MKISYNWLKTLININETPEELAVMLTNCGLEVDGLESNGNDTTIEIGLTANRGDAASHLGVARDISAITGRPIRMVFKDVITNTPIKKPSVNIELSVDCPRYSSVYIDNVKIEESPLWLKERLIAVGVKPINNVVDISNFVLHELGQPIHIYDADKISDEIFVKKAQNGSMITTLDGVSRILTGDELVISDENGILALAGVMGGISSSVSNETTNILIESAYFNPATIRKSAKTHGLNTDASFRYERGTDPNITVKALTRVIELIFGIVGGEVTSYINDNYKVVPFAKVFLRYDKLFKTLGQKVNIEDIKRIIKGLDMRINGESSDGLDISIPPYRMDVNREIDVIEEFIRIYGFNNIKSPNTMSVFYGNKNGVDNEKIYNRLANILVAHGFNEIMSNSLTKISYYKQELPQAVKILNPLSSDLEVMSMNTLYSGLEAISFNRNRKANNIKFFELGKTYSLNGVNSKFNETNWLSLYICGNERETNWNNAGKPVDFYTLKTYCNELFSALGLNVALSDRKIITNPDEINPQYLVNYGPVNQKTLKSFDINTPVFYAAINWDKLIKCIEEKKQDNSTQFRVKEISKYPEVRRDISLVIDKSITFEKLYEIACGIDEISKYIKDINVFDVYLGESIGANNKAYALSFTIQDETKTLTDSDIDNVVNLLSENFKTHANALIR